MSIAEKLKKSGIKIKQTRKEPVWSGPESSATNGGITQSLIAKWLVCRERFRLYVVDGLKAKEAFSHRMEYGNLWHCCEEALAANKGEEDWQVAVNHALIHYVQQLCRKYPLQQDEIAHWYEVCKLQFPLYVKYWSEHSDVTNRTPIVQEKIFSIPYELPSGRTVYLRGKFDAVDAISQPQNRIWLFETKSKGDLDIEQLQRQLTFDLQTMLYTVALMQDTGIAEIEDAKRKLGKGKTAYERSLSAFGGVRYNAIRRPLSGGVGTIKQHQGSKNVPAETKEEYYARVRSVIDGSGLDSKGNPYPGPKYFFIRWNVPITRSDIDRFREQSLDPILEQMCDWWCVINGGQVWPYSSKHQHFRMPYGVTSPLLDGGMSDIDHHLESGSMVGLDETNNLFPELQ